MEPILEEFSKEEFDRQMMLLLSSKSGARASSLKVYCSILRNLCDKCWDTQDLNEVQSRDAIEEALRWIGQQTMAHSTCASYTNVLHLLAKGSPVEASTMRALKYYNDLIAASEDMQDFDDKELKYAKTHEELLEVLEKYKDKVSELPAFQQTRSLTPFELRDGGWQTVFQYLALASMVLQPPIRGEYGDMPIVHDQATADDMDKRMRNYLLVLPDKACICINFDKVSDKKGPGKIEIMQQFAAAIAISCMLVPRKFLFVSKSNLAKPLKYMALFYRQLPDPDNGESMNQGIQMLRSSFITWFYQKLATNLNDKKNLAAMMRHSWETAEKHYNKIKV